MPVYSLLIEDKLIKMMKHLDKYLIEWNIKKKF